LDVQPRAGGGFAGAHVAYDTKAEQKRPIGQIESPSVMTAGAFWYV